MFSKNVENSHPVSSAKTGQCAKDGTMWSANPPAPKRTLRHNILTSTTPGPTRQTLNLSIVQTFQLIMTDEICDIIIRETNRKAIQVYTKRNEDNPTEASKAWQLLTKP